MTAREQELIRENNDLKNRLREAEETLKAIRNDNLDTTGMPGEKDKGNIKQFLTSTHEVTDSQINNTLQRFYTMLGSMYSGVLLMTEDGTIEFINQAFCDAYNLKESPDNLVGLGSDDFLSLIKPAFRNPDLASSRIIEILRNGTPVKGEELKEGRVGIRDYVPLTIGGKPTGRLWIHTDISDLKSIQAALEDSEKKFR